MGAAASFSGSSGSAKIESTLFVSKELVSFSDAMTLDQSARQAFVRYIKGGAWMAKFPMEQMELELARSNSAKILNHDLLPNAVPEKRMSFENSNKTSASAFTALTSASVDQLSNKSPNKPNSTITPPAYLVNYAEASCFSREEMTAVMFVSIFPYFMESGAYRSWLQRGDISDSRSVDVDESEMEDEQEDLLAGLGLGNASRKEGRAHQLVLGAAACCDADQLAVILSTQNWIPLVSHVVDKSNIAVTISDAKTQGYPLIYANHTFHKLSGHSAAEVLGRELSFLHGADTSTIEVNKYQRALKSRKSVRCELVCYRKNGKSFKNMMIVQPVFDSANNLSFVMALHSDVTDGPVSNEIIRGMQDLLCLIPYMLVKQ